MAQMMTDTSFGPVFVTATLPIVYVIDYNIYICYKHQLVSKKKKKKKEKSSLMAQMMPGVSVWACFCRRCPSHCVHHRLQLLCYKYQLVFQKKKEEKLTYGPNDDRHVCLGPFSSSPPFPSCMSQITIHICYKHQLVFKKKRKKFTYGPNNDRHIIQARFLNCCPSCSIQQITIYICYKHQLVTKKKEEEKRKKLTYGPNDDRHVIWAHFHNCHPFRRVHPRLQYIYAINISQYPKKRRKKKKTHLWPK